MVLPRGPGGGPAGPPRFSSARRGTPAAGAEAAVVDRDDVTSAGLRAIGIVAGTVARAVALGGRLVAAGLETLESALRGSEESVDLPPRSSRSPSAAPSGEDSDEEADGGFA